MNRLKSGAQMFVKSRFVVASGLAVASRLALRWAAKQPQNQALNFFREERGEFARGRYAAQRRASLLATQICIGMNMETAQ
ncbi:hypothetical protein [Pseudomonas capeferrum]